MKKMGRPKATKPKCVEFGVRLDEEMDAALKAYCQKHNLTRVGAIRKGIQKLIEEEPPNG